jgi:peroxiredoxin
MVAQHGLPYPVLRDELCNLASSLGLTQTLPDYLRLYYRGILVNIPFINGENSWSLPLPATIVVDRTGTVRYVEAYADFRVRPEPGHALKALDTL